MVQVGKKDIPIKKEFESDGLPFRIQQMLTISPQAPTTNGGWGWSSTIPEVLVMLTLALLNFNLA